MPVWLLLAASAIVGLAAGLAGAAWVIARAERGKIPVDVPDPRRLHTTPTPRGGGIGAAFAGLLCLPFVFLAGGAGRDTALVLVLVWALPNGLMGAIDDYRPMRSRVKFAIQVAAALAAVALGLRLDTISLPPLGAVDLPAAASWPLTVIWLVWVANVYNFMDGMDALAAGTGLVYFAAFAFVAADAGAIAPAAVAIALAGGLGGFLRHNRPPARVFMGDGGSLFLGAALGGFSVALTKASLGGYPIAASVILMGTFVWDATYTIAWRLVYREPMLPHRTHLFQRLVGAGWTHPQVRALYLGLAIVLAAAALALPRVGATAQAILVGGSLLLAISITLITRRAERQARARAQAAE
jgi:UDP-N-acetylmuramyl pentapeptide phosphotransferase/UDP-N-acetylglucosamine-1-phosphate transferase